MEYVKVAEARNRQGLRLALTMGVPGPWSQAAKYVFEAKDIPFIPVGQAGGRPNDELYEWTGHRNAPVAVYNDEPPRTGWHEIIMLAERLAPTPALLPKDSAARSEVFGIITELASEYGLAWERRLHMVRGMYATDDERMHRVADTLASRYGYTPEALEHASERAADILKMLAAKLERQKAHGSDYLVGDGFTAADLYWACFSQLIEPMDKTVNPMPGIMRELYTASELKVADAIDPVLLSHRDIIYKTHLSLPLEF